ncbi:MAG: hypothetical protein WCP85_08730 [Mariniphaga sp.]
MRSNVMTEYMMLFNSTLMLERFMTVFAINPNTTKIKKLSKNYWNMPKLP